MKEINDYVVNLHFFILTQSIPSFFSLPFNPFPSFIQTPHPPYICDDYYTHKTIINVLGWP